MHYIGMNGSRGCIPDSSDVYASYDDAVTSLADRFELESELLAELTRYGFVQLDGRDDPAYDLIEDSPDFEEDRYYGAEYAEVRECGCDDPIDEHGADDLECIICNSQLGYGVSRRAEFTLNSDLVCNGCDTEFIEGEVINSAKLLTP